MKLTARQVSNFIAKDSWKNYALLLFYGHAEDVIRQYTAKILQKTEIDEKDAFQFLRIHGSEVNNDPKILSYEASSSSLTQQDRWIVVQGKTSEIEPALKLLYAPEMQDRFGSNHFIVILEDLTTKAAILRHCSDCPWMATIPCYETDPETIYKKVQGFCHDQGWDCPSNTQDYLVNNAEQNLDKLQHILDKLVLYAPDNNQLTTDIIQECIGNDQQESVQDLILAIYSGHAEQADIILRSLLEQKTTAVMILRSITIHCSKLLRLHNLAQNNSWDQAIKSHKPPIFFKQIPEIRRQCQKWSAEKLSKTLEEILQHEIRMKSVHFHDTILLRQLILRLAKSV